MKKHHPENERIKHKYIRWQLDAIGKDSATIDHIAKALARFEEYTSWTDFRRFHHDHAVGFKKHLAKQ